LLAIGCSEDRLSDDTEPDVKRVIEAVRFEYPQDYIPELLNAEFTVFGLYNDNTEESLTTEVLSERTNWSIETDDTITLMTDSEYPNKASFSGTGTVYLTISFSSNGQIFTATQTFRITEPVLASMAIEEELNSAHLSDCCTRITEVSGNVVQGCVRQYAAIGTYDNGTTEDFTRDDYITWSTSSNSAVMIEFASNIDDFPVTKSCIEEVNTNGLVLASAIGEFQVEANLLGVKGTSDTYSVIEPTLIDIEFKQPIPVAMVEGQKQQFQVIGAYNNDTSGDVNDLLAWSTSDDETAIFLANDASGVLTAKRAATDLRVTASHLTGGSIDTGIDISEKELLSIYLDPSTDSLDWNQQMQFTVWGKFNNGLEEKIIDNLTFSVNNESVATVSSSGLITAKEPPSAATITVTAEYNSTFTATASITVSNQSSETSEIQASPSKLSLIEGESAIVSVMAVRTNLSQELLDPNDLTVSASLQVTVTNNQDNFILTAQNVDGSSDVSTVAFSYQDLSTDVEVTIFNEQLVDITLTKSDDNVIGSTAVLLTVMGIFSGVGVTSPREMIAGTDFEWTCHVGDLSGPNCNHLINNNVFTADVPATYLVTATADSSNFPYQVETVVETTTITVYDLPVVEFSSSNITAADESDGIVTITAIASSASPQDIIIPFSMSGSASSGIDYSTSTSLHQFIIAAGNVSADFVINLTDDDEVELTESISFTINGSNIINAEEGVNLVHSVNILDNDISTVSFSADSQIKNEGSGEVTVSIEMESVNFQDVTVHYQIASTGCSGEVTKKAEVNRDFTLRSGFGNTIIAAGELSGSFSFDISDDAYHEVDECLVITLTGAESATLGAIIAQNIIIKDNDTLQIIASPVTEITNTGDYEYLAVTTPFDSADYKLNKKYNLPSWEIVEATTDGATRSLKLTGTPSRVEVGETDPETVICVTDSEDGIDFSYAPGAQTACKAFSITVNSCNITNSPGVINVSGDFNGGDANCGNPNNHITIEDSKELIMVEGSFSGTVLLETNGRFNLSGGIVDSSADIQILGGTLEINGDTRIEGILDISADSMIVFDTGHTLDYVYSGGLEIGNNELDFQFTGTDASIDNESPIKLNSYSILDINSSHFSNRINTITIEADQNQAGSGGQIKTTGDITINIFNLEANGYLDIISGTTHIATDTSCDHQFTIDGPGTIEIDGIFNLNDSLKLQNGSGLKVLDNLYLNGLLAVDSGAFSTPTVIKANTLFFGGTLDIDSTTDIFGLVTTFSGQDVSIDVESGSGLVLHQKLDISSGSQLFLFGAGTVLLDEVSIDGSAYIRDTPLTINNNLSVGGSLMISDTSLTFDESADVLSGSGTITLNNLSVFFNKDFTITAPNLTTDVTTTWNVNDIKLTLNNPGAPVLSGDIHLSNGVLDIDVTSDIYNLSFSSGNDATVDINSNATLAVQTEISIPSASNLFIVGEGGLDLQKFLIEGLTTVQNTNLILNSSWDVTGDISLTNSTIIFAGADNTIRGPGTIALANASILLQRDLTINQTTINSDSSSDWDLNGHALNWASASNLVAEAVLLNSGTLVISRNITLDAPIDISGGTLKIDGDAIMVKDFGGLSGEAVLDTINESYFIYSGVELDVNDHELKLAGSGIINNDHAFDLSSANSILRLSGTDGTLYKAKFTAVSSNGKGIFAEEDFVIHTLTLDNATGRITVAPEKTLIIGNRLDVSGDSKLYVNNNATGKVVLHDIYLSGDLELGPDFTLAPDATLYILQNATLTINSDLHFNDGLVVADGATLTIDNNHGGHTVSFSGGVELEVTGTVVITGDTLAQFTFTDFDYETSPEIWDGVTVDGSADTAPSKGDALDVLSFMAVPGNASVSLGWDYQVGDFNHVLIRRKTSNYPDTTSDGNLVYDGTADSVIDDHLNGILNGQMYYYTAFAYNSSNDYANGVNALAIATLVPADLISYYPLGSKDDCSVNPGVWDGSGLGNHGTCFSNINTTADMLDNSDSAFNFNGVADAIEIDNPLVEVQNSAGNITENSFTISFWIKTTYNEGDASSDWFVNVPVIDGKVGVDQNDFGISIAQGKILFGTGDNGTNTTISSRNSINDNSWHHVAVTRSYHTGELSIFVNGELDATGDGSLNILSSPSFLGIGRSPFGNVYFDGDLDDIRIYKRILTGFEIKTLYDFP